MGLWGLWECGQEYSRQQSEASLPLQKEGRQLQERDVTDELLPTGPEDFEHPLSKRTIVSVSQLVWVSLTKLDEARSAETRE